MPRRTTNRAMNDMLRQGRDDLGSSYQYGGSTDAPADAEPKSAVIAISAEPPPESAAEAAAEPPGEAASEPTLLDPGAEDPPDQYVYALGDAPGSLVMYPPGVPCDSGGYRAAMAQPASADDVAEIQRMLEDAEGTGTKTPEPEVLSQEEMA